MRVSDATESSWTATSGFWGVAVRDDARLAAVETNGSALT